MNRKAVSKQVGVSVLVIFLIIAGLGIFLFRSDIENVVGFASGGLAGETWLDAVYYNNDGTIERSKFAQQSALAVQAPSGKPADRIGVEVWIKFNQAVGNVTARGNLTLAHPSAGMLNQTSISTALYDQSKQAFLLSSASLRGSSITTLSEIKVRTIYTFAFRGQDGAGHMAQGTLSGRIPITQYDPNRPATTTTTTGVSTSIQTVTTTVTQAVQTAGATTTVTASFSYTVTQPQLTQVVTRTVTEAIYGTATTIIQTITAFQTTTQIVSVTRTQTLILAGPSGSPSLTEAELRLYSPKLTVRWTQPNPNPLIEHSGPFQVIAEGFRVGSTLTYDMIFTEEATRQVIKPFGDSVIIDSNLPKPQRVYKITAFDTATGLIGRWERPVAEVVGAIREAPTTIGDNVAFAWTFRVKNVGGEGSIFVQIMEGGTTDSASVVLLQTQNTLRGGELKVTTRPMELAYNTPMALVGHATGSDIQGTGTWQLDQVYP